MFFRDADDGFLADCSSRNMSYRGHVWRSMLDMVGMEYGMEAGETLCKVSTTRRAPRAFKRAVADTYSDGLFTA